VLLLSANQTGVTGGLRFLGQVKVVGPGGEVLARTYAAAAAQGCAQREGHE
jgi:nitrilase